MKVANFFKYAFAAALASLAFACAKNEAVQEPKGRWGLTKEVKLSSAEGSKTVEITSTGVWKASLSYQSRSWISISGESEGNGNGKVDIEYRANDGLPRQGELYISSESGLTIDTVLVKQYGIEPYCEITGDNLYFASMATKGSVTMDTNIPVSEYENISFVIEYADSEVVGWITPVLSADLKTITVSVKDNVEFTPRKAVVRVVHKDAWGVERSSSFVVEQAIPGGTDKTVLKTFADVRAMVASTDSIVISDDIAIEGFMLGDKEGQNMGDCPEITMTRSDYSVNDLTTYIENEDGSMGFKMLFTSGDDNNTKRYSKTKIWLKGASLKKDHDPDRYTISNLGAGCIISSKEGTAESLPVKKKYIKNLTDDDIYTYVTLKKCEFPVRRGGLMMFYNDAYRNRMTKYAQVVADINGSSIRAIYNLKSPIATSTDIKTGAPKGQGSISGVIVHEKYYRFSPADGSMGRYQIRNVSTSDINISQSVSDSYSVALVEWADNASDGIVRRVHPSDYGYDVDGDPWVVQPTNGEGAYYFYNITRPQAGQWPVITQAWVHGTGLGAIADAAYGFNSWWNADAQDYNYAIWKFSTRDVTSDMVTFCLAGRGHVAAGGIPYWFLEYSVDEGASWKRVGEFTIVTQSGWSPTPKGMIAAETTSYFVIPNDILGLDIAMIRMIPSRDIMGTTDAWDGNTISSGATSAYIDICYSAVRYKK